MAQHDMNIANQGFPAFRSDLNNAISAIVSNSSGATEPSTTVAYQFWADTTNDLLKQRNAANDGWVSILTLSTGEPVTGGTQDKIEEGNSSIEIVDTGTGYAAVVIDGVETARFKAGGNFGIGTSSPTSYSDKTLHVTGGATSSSLKLSSTASGNTNADGFDVAHSGVNAYLINRENGPMSFQTNGIEGAVLDANQNLKFNSGYGSVATAYGCRAWVNFNGTGTVAIRDSGNVSSIVDYALGTYKVNFSTAMPDTNYSMVSTSMASGTAACVPSGDESTQRTTSQTGNFYILKLEGTFGQKIDPDTVQIAVHR